MENYKFKLQWLKENIKNVYRSSLLRSSTIYAAANIVNFLIPLLMIPVLTRYLDPADYGIISMFQVLVGVIIPFIGLNTQGAIARKYFERENTDLAKYIGNCFIIMFLCSLLASFIIWIFANQFSSIISIPKGWLWTIVAIPIGQFIIRVVMTLWQVQVNPFKYVTYQFMQISLNLILTIYLIVVLGRKWEGRIIAQVITVFLLSTVTIILLFKNGWLKFSFDARYFNHALKFGVPLLPHILSSISIVTMDKFFLKYLVGIASVGIYMVGFQIASIIEMLAASFNKAYVPWLYERLKKNNLKIKLRIVRFTYCYFILILLFAVTFSFFTSMILQFFVGKEFIGAAKYILWLAIGFAFNGMYYLVANYFFYAEKTHTLAIISFVTALANIALNYTLIKANGTIGAAQATALTFFLGFVLTWFLSNKTYKMPWKLALSRNKTD